MIRYEAAPAGRVRVAITDVLSRPVYTRNWAMQPGANALLLHTGGMKNGQYVITVTEGNKRAFKRLGVQ